MHIRVVDDDVDEECSDVMAMSMYLLQACICQSGHWAQRIMMGQLLLFCFGYCLVTMLVADEKRR